MLIKKSNDLSCCSIWFAQKESKELILQILNDEMFSGILTAAFIFVSFIILQVNVYIFPVIRKFLFKL